jgi:hypothetical protein
MITVHDVEQGTDEWQQLRAGKFTGSNAHKLLKYGARSYSLTEQSDFAGTFHTKRGHLLEPEAIELFEAIKHLTVDRPGFITNDAYPDCGYSPDGTLPTHIVEVKCFAEAKHLQVLEGQIPLEIMAQVQFGMLVCERKAAWLLLYNPKLDPKIAFKMIEIKARSVVQQNFRRILTAKAVA